MFFQIVPNIRPSEHLKMQPQLSFTYNPVIWDHIIRAGRIVFNLYPTAFPYGNGMVLHFYQQQESSTTKTVHKVINKGLKAYV